MNQKDMARIERDGKVWWVVVPQERGNPLKFLCETEGEAAKFMKVFERTGRAKSR